MIKDSFRVNDFLFKIFADNDSVIEALHGWLDSDIVKLHDSSGKQTENIINIKVLSDFSPEEVPEIPDQDPEATFEDVSFYPGSKNRIITVKDTVINIDDDSNSAFCYLSPQHMDSSWVLAHRVFLLPVLEILRKREAFYLHAGCVFINGAGILICGGSGHGKSTLTYALARDGFSYMSDDAVFLKANGENPSIFSFPEKLKLDSSSCSFFSEFSELPEIKGKVEISIKDSNISDVVIDGEPQFIIFPHISETGECGIQPVDDTEAMLMLIQQSISMVGNNRIEEHLDILKKLSEGTKKYRLTIGGNFEEPVRLIRGISGTRIN